MMQNLLKVGLLLAVAPIAWSQTAAQDLTSIADASPKTVDRTHYNLFNPSPSDQMRDFALYPSQTESLGEDQNWAIHFDAVEVFQGQPGFHSPYRGAQSVYSDDNFRQTSEADLFLAARVGPGGEIYFNVEYYQGFGFGETHGLDTFPNAQAYKTGQFRGDVNITRVFFRQV